MTLLYGAASSPDGTRVVTASDIARVWDAASFKVIAVLRGHRTTVARAAFSPDGARVVTASWDWTARIWRVFPTTADLTDYAKRSVARCLTRDRREKAFLDPEPPDWCIEMEKWPYHTAAWKQWLAHKRAGKTTEMPAEK